MISDHANKNRNGIDQSMVYYLLCTYGVHTFMSS